MLAGHTQHTAECIASTASLDLRSIQARGACIVQEPVDISDHVDCMNPFLMVEFCITN